MEHEAHGHRLFPLTRRQFLKAASSTAGAAAALLGGLDLLAAARASTAAIPRAALGRTGVQVPILGLGTALLGHQNHNRPDPKKLVAVFSEAIDRGLTYVDTARIYGGAEAALAEVLKTRRDRVFLATKAWAETREKAEASFEESLETLQVDHVDLLHLHSAGSQDIDKVLAEGGSWEYLQEAKKAGKCRFIGITGHSRPANFVRLLETGTVDVMMVAMNFVDRYVYGFEEKVLPVARKHQTGVMAMKVFGGIEGGFRNYGAPNPHPSQLPLEHHLSSIRYARSLEGVTGMVIGVHSAEQLRRNVELVLGAKPLEPEEMEKLLALGRTLARGWTPRFGPVT